MKFSCTHENLLTTLTYLEWVVGKQSHLPILSNILFEAEQGKLKLSATNLEIGVVTFFGAKIEEEGKIVVPAKLLTHFIQNLDPDRVIEIHQEGNQLVVENGKDEIRIQSVESKDFPIIPEYIGEYTVQINGTVLEEALQKVAFAVSHNESRIELTGVCLSISPRGVHIAATDSFRLAEYTLEGLESEQQALLTRFLEEQGRNIILPVDTLQEIVRILQKGQDNVGVVIQENQIFFTLGSTRVVSRVIQGRYPEYQQILPREFRLEVKVNKQELIRALKMATTFSQYGSGEVKCRFLTEGEVLEVATFSSGVGEQRTRVRLENPLLEDIELVFQARHVLEGVNTLSGDMVTFRMNSKDTPILITGDAPKNHFYLVMPIRK